ncbi:hypothetical protein L1987_57662 [Smallanthus sonchifolius]|uniref:Uncharacterized protein n=1 Tax=Smallanthus sonchifolius TaxID=185202 RepID=A0ACB9DD68_9ASTR|nr:hypothetical protein L1987_57662 [Smallanthus sonchifolius]
MGAGGGDDGVEERERPISSRTASKQSLSVHPPPLNENMGGFFMAAGDLVVKDFGSAVAFASVDFCVFTLAFGYYVLLKCRLSFLMMLNLVPDDDA